MLDHKADVVYLRKVQIRISLVNVEVIFHWYYTGCAVIRIIIIEKAQVRGVILYSQLFCNKQLHLIFKFQKTNTICNVDLVWMFCSKENSFQSKEQNFGRYY